MTITTTDAHNASVMLLSVPAALEKKTLIIETYTSICTSQNLGKMGKKYRFFLINPLPH